MKKIFSILAAAVIALGFASCNKNEVESKDFKIVVDSITATSAFIKVTPADTTQLYYWTVFGADDIAKYPEDSIVAFVNAELEYLQSWYQAFGYDVKLTDLLEKGESEYSFTGLNPETDFVVCALKFNEKGEAFGESTKKSFRTLKLEVSKSETITLEGLYYDALAEGYYELEAESADGTYYIYISPDVESLDEDITMANISDPDYLYFVVGEEEVGIVSLDLKANVANDILTLAGKWVATNGVEYAVTITAEEGEYADLEAPAKKAPARKNAPSHKEKSVSRIAK